MSACVPFQEARAVVESEHVVVVLHVVFVQQSVELHELVVVVDVKVVPLETVWKRERVSLDLADRSVGLDGLVDATSDRSADLGHRLRFPELPLLFALQLILVLGRVAVVATGQHLQAQQSSQFLTRTTCQDHETSAQLLSNFIYVLQRRWLSAKWLLQLWQPRPAFPRSSWYPRFAT